MKKGIIIGVILLVLVVVLFSSMYSVQENEYAVVFRFGEIVRSQNEAGLHFKIPFFETVESFSKATQPPTSRT